MNDPTLDGIFAIKLPVRDLANSREWYERTFGFQVMFEFPDEGGVVRGLAGQLTGVDQTFLGLREEPSVAESVSGFNLVNFAVADDVMVQAWATRLDDLEIEHSPIIDATIGRMIVLHDPNGIELHLYSRQRHDIDHAGAAGYGRAPARSTTTTEE